MNETFLFSSIMVTAVFVSACSQVLLKKAATLEHESTFREYLNARVLLAYGFFSIALLVNLYVLRHLPLYLVPVLESFGFVFIPVLGFIFLKERLTRRQLLGMLLIIVGVVVFSLR